MASRGSNALGCEAADLHYYLQVLSIGTVACFALGPTHVSAALGWNARHVLGQLGIHLWTQKTIVSQQ